MFYLFLWEFFLVTRPWACRENCGLYCRVGPFTALQNSTWATATGVVVAGSCNTTAFLAQPSVVPELQHPPAFCRPVSMSLKRHLKYASSACVCWRSQVKDKKLEFGVCILWVFSLNGHTFVLSLYCKHLTVESVFFLFLLFLYGGFLVHG